MDLTGDDARPTSKPGDLIVACFTFDRLHVRMVMLDSEPWFVAADICRILRIRLGTAVISVDLDDRMRFAKSFIRSGAKTLRVQEDSTVWLFSEAGVYDLVIRQGDQGEARCFRRWLTHELMPTVVRSTIATSHLVDIPFTSSQVKLSRVTKANAAKATALYRFFDCEGQLLYVGISWRLAERVLQHRRGKSWWRTVNDVKVHNYPSRKEAEAAETVAIQTEKPLYNIAKVA